MVITVEMGEGAVSGAPDVITTVGLGSCVVVTLYDAVRKVGGLAHVMLSSAECEMRNAELKQEIITPHFKCGMWNAECGIKTGNHYSALRTLHSAFQYASTAIPALLDEMLKRGCSRRNITAKIAGGAKMFSTYADFPAGIGEQNVKGIRQLLEQEGIPLTGFDVGGRHGRSVDFYLDSGRVVVKAFGREDREI